MHTPSLLQVRLRYHSSTITGEHAILRLADEIDVLACELGVGVVGRAVWSLPSVFGAGDHAWAVTVRRTSGQLAGVAVFVDRWVDCSRVVTLAGTEGGFGGTVMSESAAAAVELARAIAVGLVDRGYAADIGPVRGARRVLVELAEILAGRAVLEDEPIPHLRRCAGPELAAYVSHNMRKTLRRASNRFRTDGLRPRLEFTSEPTEVNALLPSLASAYQDRDHAKGRPSQLDTPEGRQAWEQRLLQLVESGWGEVVSLRVDDTLVAYVVGIRDGSWYGIREGRFLTSFNRYAPGRLLEAAVVQRALHDPALVGIDWLSSVAPESLLADNGAVRALRLSLPALPGA